MVIEQIKNHAMMNKQSRTESWDGKTEGKEGGQLCDAYLKARVLKSDDATSCG